MGMAEKVLLNTPHVLSAPSPANSRCSRPRRRPRSAARFWPTPSPRAFRPPWTAANLTPRARVRIRFAIIIANTACQVVKRHTGGE